MVAILFRMNAGIAGTVTRIETAVFEPQLLDPANPVPSFGVPVKLGSNGRIQPITTGDAATAIYGFMPRPYPGMATTYNISDSLGQGTPPPAGSIFGSVAWSVLRRGYIQVLLGGAAAAVKNAPLFVRVAAAATGKPIGGIEAAADSTNTIQVANAGFVGPADAAGNTEIWFNI